MSKETRGFTLIELIVVILILGILAAIAAPKFIDLTGQARIASLKGLRAAVSSASNLANALTVAQGNSANQSITIEGNQTVLMKNYYPSDAAGGIDVAVRFDSVTFNTGASSPTTFQVKSAPTVAGCAFTYTAPTATTLPPTITTVTTTGC
ncbi:MAG TPA: prepilin-type N-terminal cleavage/methylation domain-containing protein [Burkholderiales bacterium]